MAGGKKPNQILEVSEIIHGLLTEQGSAPLTPTFFKGQPYSEFLLMCKNILTYENIEEKVSIPHESSLNSQTGVSSCSYCFSIIIRDIV